jgi:RNA polymerase sigma-70 factor (ECF subfamily)
VLRSLQRLGVPPADLEDVAHDVFVVVYRRWADFDRDRPVRPWLFGIAFRTAARVLDRRWRSAEVPAGGGELGESAGAVASGAAASGEAREICCCARIAALDLEHRVVAVNARPRRPVGAGSRGRPRHPREHRVFAPSRGPPAPGGGPCVR